MTDNKITLQVKSPSGVFTDDFNLNNKADKVFDEALRYFRLAQGGGTSYTLVRERDRSPIALGEKLGDLGLANGEVLLLHASQAQDG